MEMLVMSFMSFWAALVESAESEVKYELIKHFLDEGETVDTHVEDEDEWLCLRDGRCSVRVGDEVREFDLDGGSHKIICIPRGVPHSLAAKSQLTYFVLKT